jgi:periplasmic divalent cation tolerance protein
MTDNPATHCLIYMTATDQHEARAMARTLVEARLAACVNIIGGMRSVYRWQGDIHEDDEIVVIAKTRRDLVAALTDKIRDMHSHDCPCVVSVPIEGGNPAFLDWIDTQTE